MGFNDLRKKKTDATGNQQVSIAGPSTTFGEVAVAQSIPVAQGDFIYGVNNQVFDTRETLGGTVAVSDGMAVLSSGTDPSGSALVQLRRGLKYRPGQGSLMRATALFSEPVSGNSQLLGLGNKETGYFIGYRDTEFGVLHREDGTREVRKLTISVAAGSEDITIELEGDTIVVPVVGGGSTTQTAYQLSLADYTGVGSNGWLVDVVGSDVYFISTYPGPKGGTYSISSTGTGDGTFSQLIEGVASEETFIPSGSFNIDKLDGTGPSNMTLDPQKGNVYQIGFQYLGFGNAKFSIEDPLTGFQTIFHEIRNANTRTTPVLKNPNVSVLLESSNTGGTTSKDVKTLSMSGFVEGTVRPLDPKFAKSFTFTNINSSTYKPLAILKANKIHNNKSCFGEFDILELAGSNQVNNQTVTIGIFLNKQINGNVNYQKVDDSNSVVSYAALNPASGGNTIVSPIGTPIYELIVGSASAKTSIISHLEFIFSTLSNVVIAIKTSGSCDGQVSLVWYEQQ